MRSLRTSWDLTGSPVRRFAIFSRGKLRCIDDLSENSINSSWEVAEKVDLKAMDELLLDSLSSDASNR